MFVFGSFLEMSGATQFIIDFAEKVALKLGYKPAVVAELSAYIYSDPNITTNRDFLISLASDYQINDD